MRIVAVECLTGQTVSIHFEIKNQLGIASYGLWSTWGGGGEINHEFVDPLPLEVDETVEFTHTSVDPAPRVHQFGLVVEMQDIADPVITFEIEPNGRCPGH